MLGTANMVNNGVLLIIFLSEFFQAPEAEEEHLVSYSKHIEITTKRAVLKKNHKV